MTLYQLEVFALVAKHQSFTKAAKELRVGQPTVSALMIQLQKELGVKLFEQLGVRTHLTQPGTKLLRRTQTMLALVQEAKDEMEELKGLKKGKVSVGGSVLAAAFFLPIAVQAFTKEHPELEVVLKVERSEVLEKMLLEGELDVAFMGLAPRSPLIVAQPCREEEIVVIAPPNHPLTKKRSVPLALLAATPLISAGRLPVNGGVLREIVEREFAKRRLSSVPWQQVNLDIGSRDVVRTAVASGLGIGFISKCHILSDAKAGRLKILNVPELKLKRTMYLAVHRQRRGSGLIRLFNDFVKRYWK
jgi:LysR family transcriptional regulator, low CO2-responsive transcriptional regulator